MAQTIAKREFFPNLDLLIIDECHIQRKVIQDFARQWGGRVIGLTATPIVKGLRETWETLVNATTTDALVADGHLAPVEIYAATEIDMTGAAKTAGEWTAGAVRERSGLIIGDIVSTWARYTSEHFGGPAKTLLFSADTAHGSDLCQAFQAAGFDFRQSTYRDSNEVTTSMVEGFRRGDFTGLVSVSKFVKGFDVPDVLIGVDARPNSGSLHEVMQKLGRVTRSSPGKEKALWLCFAGIWPVGTRRSGRYGPTGSTSFPRTRSPQRLGRKAMLGRTWCVWAAVSFCLLARRSVHRVERRGPGVARQRRCRAAWRELMALPGHFLSGLPILGCHFRRGSYADCFQEALERRPDVVLGRTVLLAF